MPKVREAIKLIEADGWRKVTTKGSHRQFKYPRRTAQPLTRPEREGIRAVWGCECCGWDSGRKPYPGKKARGQRLGLGRRTNASGKVTWRHPESTKSIVAPVADQHVSQTVVCDRRARAPSGARHRVSYPVSDSMSCIHRACQHGSETHADTPSSGRPCFPFRHVRRRSDFMLGRQVICGRGSKLAQPRPRRAWRLCLRQPLHAPSARPCFLAISVFAVPAEVAVEFCQPIFLFFIPPTGIVTLIVLGRKGPHGFPFRRPHSQFPIH